MSSIMSKMPECQKNKKHNCHQGVTLTPPPKKKEKRKRKVGIFV